MTAHGTDQEKILDIAALKNAFMNDLEIIKQILTSFQETTENFEQHFKKLEAQGESESLSRLVHGLKGSSANIRAEKVSNQAAQVQRLIDQGQNYELETAELLTLLSKLENQINHIKSE